MHILAFILIFVVGSIIAACDGDYSGIAAIGKFVGFFVLLFAVLWLFTQPVLLIIAIVVLVLIVIAFSAKQHRQIKYNGVLTLGLAVIIYLHLYGYLWYHIREVFSFIGELGGAICLNRQIRN